MMIIPTISDLPAASECVMNMSVLFVLLNILHLETVFCFRAYAVSWYLCYSYW